MNIFVDADDIKPYINNPAFQVVPVRSGGKTTCYAVSHTPVRSIVAGNTSN